MGLYHCNASPEAEYANPSEQEEAGVGRNNIEKPVHNGNQAENDRCQSQACSQHHPALVRLQKTGMQIIQPIFH